MSKLKELASMKAMAAGLLKNQAGQTLSVNSTQIKVADLVATFNEYEAQVALATAARAAWVTQLEAVKQVAARAIPLEQGAEVWVRAQYGARSPRLLDYGLSPRAPRKPKPAVKTAAIEKSAATRVARHTMGKRQKATIHGAPPAQTPSAGGGSGVKSS